MSELPDRLNIDKKDRELYKILDVEEIVKFKDSGGTRTRREQFIFAMAYGFYNGVKKALDANEGFVLEKDLHKEDYALLDAIAICNTDSVEVLADRKAVFKIAEEYAHAGIKLLSDKIKGSQIGLYEKELEKALFEIFNK